MLTPQDTFENTFNQQIVVAGQPTFNDNEPVTVCIRNINRKSFDIHLQELDYKGGNRVPESFRHIEMGKCLYALDNDTKIEASSFISAKSFSTITQQQAYNHTPGILSQIITERDSDAAIGRISDISQNSLDYLLQEHQTTKVSDIVETVDYIAREPDRGELADLTNERPAPTADGDTLNWFDFSFQSEFHSYCSLSPECKTTTVATPRQ